MFKFQNMIKGNVNKVKVHDLIREHFLPGSSQNFIGSCGRLIVKTTVNDPTLLTSPVLF